MLNRSHLTAIARKTASKPMQYLSAHGFLKGKMLDFGCGRGVDADTFGMAKYDPYFFKCDDFAPDEFDTITCMYVLNVIPDEKERDAAIERILRWLRPDGWAYIAVRADKKELNGWTSRGTWQGYIELPYRILHRTKEYDLYQLTK
jgi:2-polyprenyl-3-methyl-5-hydroxy-6-metoxy-1,4-benzoquinol methylase